jgi:dynein heavy chain
VIKGVVTKRINPKSITIDEMFGRYNPEQRTWQEGIFTEAYREYSQDTSTKQKWLILDGAVDSAWVENLNSALDDNRKMSLPNGESIYLSQGMSLLMETDSLTHATPATISRCGIIYMQPNHYVKPKYLLNTWLRKLPPNLLADAGAMDIENYCNFLLSAAFEVVDRARHKEQLVFS